MYAIGIPRKRLIDDITEVAGGSDSEDQGVAETETTSESQARLFNDHCANTRNVSTNNRISASLPAGQHRGARETKTESEMRIVLNAPFDFDVVAVLPKRRKLKAYDARTSAATMTKAVK